MSSFKAAAMAIIAAIVLLMLSAWLTRPAHAQEQCGPHERLLRLLGRKYGEGRHGAGLINEKAMLELFVSKRGTFTITVTDDHGIACVLAGGDAWEDETDFVAGGSI
jgi:hypothetical protein